MDEVKHLFYNMTCRTEGCIANNVTIRGLGPEQTSFMCGSCSKVIEDFTICQDQETKDGCVEFCPDSASHSNWAECYNAKLMRDNPPLMPVEGANNGM